MFTKLRHSIVKVLAPKLYTYIDRTRPMIRFIKNSGKTRLVGVEIGVSEGYNAKNILEVLDMKRLYLIDPYIPYFDKKLWNPQSSFFKARRVLAEFGNKVSFVKEKSEDAIHLIPQDVDFVYVDADHSYESVKTDIGLYYPKVKRGGVFGGHDFSTVNMGVCKAVIEFVEAEGLKLHGEILDWWVCK